MEVDQLVTSSAEAKKNIYKYAGELSKSSDLQAVMSYARTWHAYRTPEGEWRAAPSKFVGYAENTADGYTRRHKQRDGRRAESVLARWFEAAAPGSASYEDAARSIALLFARYGKAPNKRFRICVPKPQTQSRPATGGLGTVQSQLASRITTDPAICGGRPTIRGMRIRVSDLLDLLAAGLSNEEILADYPYLEPEDLHAALAFAARAADHRILTLA